MTRAVTVNGAFRSQRVTGQQRYATEIADRLAGLPGFTEVAPTGGWSGSSAREWAWTLARLPALARRSVLLSLTARGPLLTRQVLVVHDLFVLTNPEWYSRAYILTHAPVLRLQLRRAHAIIAVSEPVAEQVRQRYDREVVVAPNAAGPEFGRAEDGDADVLARRGLVADGYLLTVASHDPRKNLASLAEAYAAISPERRRRMPLVTVGGGAGIYRGQQIDWPEEVVHAGYVDDDELRALYAGARALVLPSLAEGFGLPLVEASAAGTRGLVVSDIPPFRWICGDGAQYVDPASIASMTAGLERAIDDALPAVTVDRARFDWDASAAIVADVCLRVGDAR